MAESSITPLSLSLEDIYDPVLQAKVKHLMRATLPSCPVRHIRDVVLACQGDVNLAASLLFCDPSGKILEAIESLQKRFPQSDELCIIEILLENAGDYSIAESLLSRHAIESENDPQNDVRSPSSSTSAHTHSGVQSFCVSTKPAQTAPSYKAEYAQDDFEKVETSDTSGERQPSIKVKEEDISEIPPIWSIEESRNCGQKRKASSFDNQPDKRHRLQNDDDATEETGSLEPASEWVNKFFPGGQPAVILLGPEEVLRNTIPRKVLYENSSFFRNHYDKAEEEEDDTVRLPNVDPQMFDLAIQCLVAKGFTLEHDCNRSKAFEITVLLDLMFLTVTLGLPDPSEAVVEKLRDILVAERRALKHKHMKRAFELEDGHSIQGLFVQAVVSEFMKTRENRSNRDSIDTDTDDEDDESRFRDAAHRHFTYKNGFRFQKEFKTIRAFKLQLLEEQNNVLESGRKKLLRSATKLREAIYTTEYTDPLDEEVFFL